MHNLPILTDPAVAHTDFGWFNLAWPNIGFWIAAIVLFALFVWGRIPLLMEADAASRRNGVDK